MATFSGSFTVSNTNPITLSSLPFTPALALLTVSSTTEASENDQARFSTGSASDAFCGADAMLANSNGFYSREYRSDNNRCLVALATPGGVLTRALDLAFDSFGTNSVTFNVLNKAAGYTFVVRAELFD